MSAARTLRNLRADAAPDDRISAALAANGIANPYRYASQPKTLEELRQRCGKHGPAAVECVKWGAVGSWCMALHPCPAKWANAVQLVKGEANSRIFGKPSPMAGMDTPYRRSIGRIAIEALRAWEEAGSPHHHFLRDVRTTHQLVFNIERIKAEEAEAQQTKGEETR